MTSPVTVQPGGAGPGLSPVCLPGLEYLTTVDKLILSQKVEVAEAVVGFETANKYTVKNGGGQHVYFAAEDSGTCMRLCCNYVRSFDMRILDSARREVLHLRRPLRCQRCCFPCCLQQLEVSSAGQVIGQVSQDWSLFRPSFSVSAPGGPTVLTIRGPCCRWTCCRSQDFDVLAADGRQEIGVISKQWSGLAKEVFTDTDNFGLSFPIDLDVNMKATLLGAAFLIDFMYFESSLCCSDSGCCVL